eukprot:m.12807 g.12807  ORF g.12807 m.12807 type:complete len:61 (+) comp17879_c0_seq1:75-257(+)
MCFPLQCKTCRLTTWGGCGFHKSSVFARVPVDNRCICDASLKKYAFVEGHSEPAGACLLQ